MILTTKDTYEMCSGRLRATSYARVGIQGYRYRSSQNLCRRSTPGVSASSPLVTVPVPFMGVVPEKLEIEGYWLIKRQLNCVEDRHKWVPVYLKMSCSALGMNPSKKMQRLGWHFSMGYVKHNQL
nr:hypothetical protein Iba_chr13fCG9930 [Ipomoea batatas]